MAALTALLLSSCATGSPDADNAAQRGVVPASPAVPGPVQRYVALGDSYTSAPLVPVTDVANGCFRSSGNYPARVARALGAHLVDRSCGGATTRHLWRPQFPGVPPQLRAVNRRTDLVSLGIGGNDGEVFRRMLENCARANFRSEGAQPCRERMTTASGRDRLLDAVARTRASLLRAVRAIHHRAPDARVLLVGYPQLLAAGRSCDQLPLAHGDYAYVAKVNRALDQNLRYAARRAEATYVDVWSASKGHDICAKHPWVNGSQNDQQRAAAFHPFATEQQAVADLVVRTLHD